MHTDLTLSFGIFSFPLAEGTKVGVAKHILQTQFWIHPCLRASPLSGLCPLTWRVWLQHLGKLPPWWQSGRKGFCDEHLLCPSSWTWWMWLRRWLINKYQTRGVGLFKIMIIWDFDKIWPLPHAGDVGLMPALGRSPGEGNGNWLQYSYI